jgi:hypothetical protein
MQNIGTNQGHLFDCLLVVNHVPKAKVINSMLWEEKDMK